MADFEGDELGEVRAEGAGYSVEYVGAVVRSGAGPDPGEVEGVGLLDGAGDVGGGGGVAAESGMVRLRTGLEFGW